MAGKKIRVIHFGLGPIGCGIARVVASRADYQIVGAVDIDPAKAVEAIDGIRLRKVIKVHRDNSRGVLMIPLDSIVSIDLEDPDGATSKPFGFTDPRDPQDWTT